MPLFGTLSTMPLQDLLQWLGSTARTGTLKVERDRVAKSVLLRGGRIFGCNSNDPPEKLGHFLLSRGRVTEQQLRSALNSQETSRKYLGEQFVAMGVLTEEELASHLKAQAAETLYGLFDWDEAVFRFSEDLDDQPRAFEVDLDIAEVVARGLERAEEVQRIREVFPDRTVILRKTAMRLPAEALSNDMARTLYDGITDDRSLAELLLHVHGSEYLVTKFLFALHSSGFVEVLPAGGVTAAPVSEPVPAMDSAVEAAVDSAVESGVVFPAAASGKNESSGAAAPERATAVAAPTMVPTVAAPTTATAVADGPAEADDLDLSALPLEPLVETPLEHEEAELLEIPDLFQESSDLVAAEDSPEFRLRRSMTLARKQLSENRYEEALSTLEELVRDHPNDDALRRLLAEAESSFTEKAYRHYVPASKTPSLCRPLESLEQEKLSPSEFFLISRIDGSWDVKSIVQIAPMREVDVLIALKRLREKGVIEFS